MHIVRQVADLPLLGKGALRIDARHTRIVQYLHLIARAELIELNRATLEHTSPVERNFTIFGQRQRLFLAAGCLPANGPFLQIDIDQLAADQAKYEAVLAALQAKNLAGHEKLAANWTMGELSAALNKDNLDVTQSKIDASRLAGLLARIADETISGKIAKEVFEQMWAEGRDADAIIEAKGLKQITDTGAIERLIDEVMAANPKQLGEYRSGKDKLFGFFVGQVMKVSAGKANPEQVNALLKKKLAP